MREFTVREVRRERCFALFLFHNPLRIQHEMFTTKCTVEWEGSQ